MKKILMLLSLLLSFNFLFASVSPNVLINGYLGQDSPATIELRVNSTIIEDNGSAVAISDNYNFSTNRSSYLQPVSVYIGNNSGQTSNNAFFTLTVSTEGFKKRDVTNGDLIGSPLDVDIQMFTSSVDTLTSSIIVASTNVLDYNQNIFLNLSPMPATFTYVVTSGVDITDENYIIYFTWSEKNNVPAGTYGSLISFSITAI